jgi:hypothetical protein
MTKIDRLTTRTTTTTTMTAYRYQTKSLLKHHITGNVLFLLILIVTKTNIIILKDKFKLITTHVVLITI